MDVVETLTRLIADRYTIERELGRGGMATVYLARDLRHRRKVALKVLNPELGAVLGAERFLSEIQVTANLQHPNLLPLFDSGEAAGLLYYVMPFVEGESLRVRLTRERQLSVDEAIHLAVRIAGALDYAHQHGVVHRDLKPENILLSGGQPLVADFGIALAVSNAGGTRITQSGLSLGTPQYMSPEQATGDRQIDARSDVYSLAAVTYEMLTGDPPFTASTVQAIVARILTDLPHGVRASRPAVPEHVEVALLRALEKIPADRPASAREFADALEGRTVLAPFVRHEAIPANAVTARITPLSLGDRLRDPMVILFGVIAVAGIGSGIWIARRREGQEQSPTIRFAILPTDSTGVVGSSGKSIAISPDGRLVAFAYRDRTTLRSNPGTGTVPAGTIGPGWLLLHQLDQGTSRPIPHSDAGLQPVFSPDGEWIAFLAGNELRKVKLADGSLVRMARLDNRMGVGLSWTRPDRIIIGSNVTRGLSAVPAEGGEPVVLSSSDTLAGEGGQGWPVLLPDGRNIVYSSRVRGAAPFHLVLLSVQSGERVSLGVTGSSPLGLIDDLLVYHDGERALMGVRLDLEHQRILGAPILLIDSVAVGTGGAARAALSRSGTLAFQSGLVRETKLALLGRDGRVVPFTSRSGRFAFPRYSPDGARVAVTVVDDSSSDIWIIEKDRETLRRLTHLGDAYRPEWTPDGKRVLFIRSRNNAVALGTRRSQETQEAELWWEPSDGSGQPEVVAQDSLGVHEGVVSPDGRYLVYRRGRPPNEDLLYRELAARNATPVPLAASTQYREWAPAFSPDGRWLAFVTNETGEPQVYAMAFPAGGPKYPVSVGGGSPPQWNLDGRQIFYSDTNRQGIAANVVTGPHFEVTERHVVFDPIPPLPTDVGHRVWDLAPNGSGWIIPMAGATSDINAITVIHNWAAEVRNRLRRPPPP